MRIEENEPARSQNLCIGLLGMGEAEALILC
jgi:hypothetical protein